MRTRISDRVVVCRDVFDLVARKRIRRPCLVVRMKARPILQPGLPISNVLDCRLSPVAGVKSLDDIGGGEERLIKLDVDSRIPVLADELATKIIRNSRRPLRICTLGFWIFRVLVVKGMNAILYYDDRGAVISTS